MDLDFAHFASLFATQVGAYLIGAIPFGYLAARWAAGIDIRKHGSGNIGATNVGRVLGTKFFFLVFVLDLLKGLIPVGLAMLVQTRYSDPSAYDQTQVWYLPEAAGLAAILGHMFPIYLGFRGGKGVATSIGVLLVLAPFALFVGLATWLVLVAVTRMVSAGSLGFAVAFATAYFFTQPVPWSIASIPRSVFVLTTSVLVIVQHRSNIGRILRGEESRVGRSIPKTAAEAEPQAG
jgi:glycerol-3-phosphate acyltransferase PlsY